jgi:2'-5' RNA ligase
MYESFLSTAKTIPHCERDFAEWHRGASQYGFWAVLVDDPDWLALFEAACSHVRQFIHPGYRRAPHITVAACGLLSEGHFSPQLQKRQTTALTEAKMTPFFLETGPLDSFTSAPYITVEYPAGSLDQIRSILAAVSEEDDPADYKPHITLGLYQGAFDTSRVANHLSRFRHLPTRSLQVNELSFCVYETRSIQGPFIVLERVALNCVHRIEEVPDSVSNAGTYTKK